jgi:hypothetical protein
VAHFFKDMESPPVIIERAVAWWHWTCLHDTCVICNTELELPPDLSGLSSLEQQTPAVSASSVCAHVFHTACIEKWLTYRTVCPLCNQTWAGAYATTVAIDDA